MKPYETAAGGRHEGWQPQPLSGRRRLGISGIGGFGRVLGFRVYGLGGLEDLGTLGTRFPNSSLTIRVPFLLETRLVPLQ